MLAMPRASAAASTHARCAGLVFPRQVQPSDIGRGSPSPSRLMKHAALPQKELLRPPVVVGASL